MRVRSPFVHCKEKINFDCFHSVHIVAVYVGAKFPYENYGILFAHFMMSNLFV
jgi:hypothetical protein